VSCKNFLFCRSCRSSSFDCSHSLSNQTRRRSFESGAKSIQMPSAAAAHTAIHQCPVAAATPPAPARSDRLYALGKAERAYGASFRPWRFSPSSATRTMIAHAPPRDRSSWSEEAIVSEKKSLGETVLGWFVVREGEDGDAPPPRPEALVEK